MNLTSTLPIFWNRDINVLHSDIFDTELVHFTVEKYDNLDAIMTLGNELQKHFFDNSPFIVSENIFA